MAVCEGKAVGFAAVLHLPHPHKMNFKRISRLVILPDWQGLGVGSRFVTEIAEWYKSQNLGMTLATSNPALKHSLVSHGWRCIRAGRTGSFGKGEMNKVLNKSSSGDRYTVSFEYEGKTAI